MELDRLRPTLAARATLAALLSHWRRHPGQLATLLRARYCDPKIRSICKTDGLGYKIREILDGVAEITA